MSGKPWHGNPKERRTETHPLCSTRHIIATISGEKNSDARRWQKVVHAVASTASTSRARGESARARAGVRDIWRPGGGDASTGLTRPSTHARPHAAVQVGMAATGA